PCRVPRPNNHHLFAAAKLGFHLGGSIVDPGAFEIGEPRNVEPAIFDARGYQDATGPEPSPVRQGHDALATVDDERADLAANGDAATEALSLQMCIWGEVLAGVAGGKPKVVRNRGVGPCLPPRRESISSQHTQSSRRRVHGSGQTSGSRPDHNQ